jgi:hypothetical protein
MAYCWREERVKKMWCLEMKQEMECVLWCS